MAVTRQVIMELGAKQAASLKQSWGIMGRSLGRIRNAAKGLAATFLSIKGIIIGALVRGAFRMMRNAMRSVTQAAIRQEDAVVRLNNAFRTAGIYSEKLSRDTRQFASSLQAVTRFGDEAILEMQALLVTYGVSADKLKEATRASLDFATATGRDVRSAALTVGKAAAGFTGELSRYGIIVETEGIAKSKVFEKVLAKLGEQFGGRAQADVKTYAGRMVQMGNAWGDFLEQIGDLIIKSPVMLDILKRAKERFEEWTDWIKQNKAEMQVWVDETLETLKRTIEEIGRAVQAVTRAYREWQKFWETEHEAEYRKMQELKKDYELIKKVLAAQNKLAKMGTEEKKKHLSVVKEISAEYSKQVQSMARQFGLMSGLEKAQVRYLAEQLKGAKGFEFFQRMTEAQREMVGRSKILGAITEKKGFGERAAEQYLGAGFLKEVEQMQQVNVQAQIKSEIEVKMMLDAQAVAKKFLESVYPRIQQAVLTATNALSQKWEQMQQGNRAAIQAGIGPSP